jgi:TadE-like protein
MKRTTRQPLRGLRGERGQAITEFAMVLPLFAALVFVLVLFGKALYVYIQVTHIANEGARLAAVDMPTSSSLSSYLAGEYALPSGALLAICYPAGAQSVGQPVKIVAYTKATWVPFISSDIKSSATMRLEQDTSTNPNLAHLDPDHEC